MNYCWPNNFYIYTKKQMASGGELKVMGKRIVRTEVKFELAKLIVKQIVQQVVECTVCGTEGAENPNCHFQPTEDMRRQSM